MSSTTPTTTNTNTCVWTNSIFCPYIPVHMTKTDIRQAFESTFAVQVERIDLNNNVLKGCIQAFVHFSSWNNADQKTLHLKTVLMEQNTPFVWKFGGEQLLLFVNHKPIPTPEQNEHQVSASITICRELIEQQKTITDQLFVQIIEQNRMMAIMRQEILNNTLYIQTLFQQTGKLEFVNNNINNTTQE